MEHLNVKIKHKIWGFHPGLHFAFVREYLGNSRISILLFES